MIIYTCTKTQTDMLTIKADCKFFSITRTGLNDTEALTFLKYIRRLRIDYGKQYDNPLTVEIIHE